MDLIIEPILFLCNTIFSFYYTRVRPQYDYSILGRNAQGWINRTLIDHERAIVHFLVLLGSLWSITEITEYTYFSPMWTLDEFNYGSD